MGADYNSVAFQAVAHAAVFCQQQCQRLNTDGNRSFCKCRVVKQSTLARALLVLQHRNDCPCTAVNLALWYDTHVFKYPVISTTKMWKFEIEVPVLMLPSLQYTF